MKAKSYSLTCIKCGRAGNEAASDRREASKKFYSAGWRGDIAEGKPLCPDCAKAAIVVVPHGDRLKIPAHVAVCPKCGAEIIAEFDEWEQLDDGTWAAGDGGTHINCTTEPDIDQKEWREWFGWHWEMPYVDWMPLQARVLHWINDHYRFEMSETGEAKPL